MAECDACSSVASACFALVIGNIGDGWLYVNTNGTNEV